MLKAKISPTRKSNIRAANVRYALCFFTLLIILNAPAQLSRTVNNTSFKKGEHLTYRIHYGFLDAGEAKLDIKDTDCKIEGRETYHIVGTGVSTGILNFFFKINDRYETYIDTQSLCPLLFIRRVDEGGFKISQDMLFDQRYNVVNSNGKDFNIPPYIQDMLSAFYYARTLDYAGAKPGKVDSVVTFVDNQVWSLKIIFIGRDTLDSDIGKIACLLFEPSVQKGRIFKHSNDLQVWISDDKNHVPVRAQASILVGSLKVDLESYTGMENNFALIK